MIFFTENTMLKNSTIFGEMYLHPTFGNIENLKNYIKGFELLYNLPVFCILDEIDEYKKDKDLGVYKSGVIKNRIDLGGNDTLCDISAKIGRKYITLSNGQFGKLNKDTKVTLFAIKKHD